MKTPSRFLAGPSFSNRITALKPVVRSEALLRIERNWNELAEAAGAAKIIIVNDIDNTAPVDEDFVYLENTRRYDEQNHLPSQYQLLKSLPKIKCPSCKKNRTCSSHCECDEMMVFHDDEFVNIRPYDEDGLFRFNVPPGGIVNECNIGCPCDKSVCVNSVAQHPRSIPIEVFKTQNRGWGVRSSVFVKKGTVLGIYTGDLIHRQIAEDLEGDQTTYVFDLDTDEDCDTDISENAYSVNAMYSGNWTRFINHSCAPNLKIYSASWEIRAEMGMQNLVFVAACNIKPGIEFTFDYDPEQSGADEVASNNNHVKKEKDRDKSRGHIPRGAILCLCMAVNCRGWVRAFSSKH
ncbi:SET domain-containing protein [Dendrothele bispora CBS 962.96]|uniref:SET domain-containing protein n=1 Tax=Dendrothele bispora (strain CBS 962.96) TaxID=1314807 RepID=A0A4S8LYX2_DENBC|nr:SET domain-containing protein [Dendrothele bispora CBS 962.96]